MRGTLYLLIVTVLILNHIWRAHKNVWIVIVTTLIFESDVQNMHLHYYSSINTLNIFQCTNFYCHTVSAELLYMRLCLSLSHTHLFFLLIAPLSQKFNNRRDNMIFLNFSFCAVNTDTELLNNRQPFFFSLIFYQFLYIRRHF